MSRFAVSLDATTLTVVDTGVTPNRTVIDMLRSELHQAINPTEPLATLTALSVNPIEHAFDSPNGAELEMGFDLTFTLTAGGVAAQVGKFTLSGLAMRTPVERLGTYLVNTFTCRSAGSQNQNNYPGDMYAPVVVLRNTLYNVCASICYAALDYNHSFNIFHRVETFAKNPSRIAFIAALGNGLNPTHKIPAGETRVYQVRFRINDRTDTTIPQVNPPTDAPTEWLWTLRGYQQHFRHLYGKPNYRSMGGWDGRPCYAAYMVTSLHSLNHRE